MKTTTKLAINIFLFVAVGNLGNKEKIGDHRPQSLKSLASKKRFRSEAGVTVIAARLQKKRRKTRLNELKDARKDAKETLQAEKTATREKAQKAAA